MCVREEGLEPNLEDPTLHISSHGPPLDADVRKQCCNELQQVLKHKLVGTRTKSGTAFVSSCHHYLDLSEQDGVWVEGVGLNGLLKVLLHSNHHTGYHWLYAVCILYNVCIVVVIHCHEYTHVFGNRQHPRIYLYKADIATHYDVLLPNNAPVQPNVRVVPETPGKYGWWCTVVYGLRW